MEDLNDNRRAFLDMIAISELGQPLIDVSDHGYNVLVGSTAENPVLFPSYADHPRRLVKLDIHGREVESTAAGRYQLLARYYDSYSQLLGLSDFTPESQDAIALQQIKECHALPDIDAGRVEDAIGKVAHLWASLPGAGYDQHENKYDGLVAAYLDAGGQLGDDTSA